MYQLQLDCTSKQSFDAALNELDERLSASSYSACLFHVFSASVDPLAASETCAVLQKRFPNIPYICSTTSGNLVDGTFTRDGAPVSVAVSVFEDPDTKLEVVQLPLDYETQNETVRTLLGLIEEKPWIKAIEVLTTINDANIVSFCKELNSMPPHIAYFGGGAIDPETDFANVTVASSAGKPTNHGIVFVLYGGENFHALTIAVHGWRPLGMPFHITRAERSTLYELNNKPAYEVYNNYLKIAEDDDFSWNGLLFPIAIDYDGVQILRTPASVNPDGSLVLPADISDEHHDCRIAYGDPATILHGVEQTAQKLQAFRPQGILCFSCAARLVYWGDSFVNRETLPFQSIAPTTGFFTGGEFIRHGGHIIQHNVTLVLTALREGNGDSDLSPERLTPVKVDSSGFDRQLAIINRMASFIGAASDELQDAYKNMEIMARTDGLTGLLDRREIERLIGKACKGESLSANKPPRSSEKLGEPALIMLDLDDFKHVNDKFGHEIGDEVLRMLAKTMRRIEADSDTEILVGRWGGEEFMLLLPYASLKESAAIAENLRAEFASLAIPEIGRCTMSLGVAKALPGESLNSLCSRVDDALYRAKTSGKNCVALSEIEPSC